MHVCKAFKTVFINLFIEAYLHKKALQILFNTRVFTTEDCTNWLLKLNRNIIKLQSAKDKTFK